LDSKLKIYTDFDGTITAQDTWMDVGNYFINDKEKWAEVIRKFENLEIGARECFLTECALIQDFDFDQFNKIVDNQVIDDHFRDFILFCRKNDIPLTILSEGLDYYISRILKNNSIDLPYYANKFVLSQDRKSFHLEFPYSDSECIKCGCCKRNLILNMTADDEISVLIGDGFSDVCAAAYADIVFAKKSLASYCWKNNITYFEFRDFSDIKKKLEKVLLQKKLKHRQTAKFKRREVFLRG
jgi:2,3-diketo-5-methylthio-1-phosphopentane phosphatase